MFSKVCNLSSGNANIIIMFKLASAVDDIRDNLVYYRLDGLIKMN